MEKTIVKTINFMENDSKLSFSEQSVTEKIQFQAELQDTPEDQRNSFGGLSAPIELMKTVPKLGITSSMLSDMLTNFNNGIPRPEREVAIGFSHDKEDGDAAGWIVGMKLSENGERLLGMVDFTREGTEKIQSGVFKFFSPTILRKFNPIDGPRSENVLFGGALSNQPRLRLNELNLEKDENMMKFSTKESKNMSQDDLEERYADVTAKKEGLVTELEGVKEQFSSSQTKNEELLKENTQLKEQFSTQADELKKFKDERESERFESAFDKLVEENKAVPAQKEFFSEKFDADELVKFSETAVKVFPDKKGSSSSDSPEQFSENVKEIAALDIGHDEKALQNASILVEESQNSK